MTVRKLKYSWQSSLDNYPTSGDAYLLFCSSIINFRTPVHLIFVLWKFAANENHPEENPTEKPLFLDIIFRIHHSELSLIFFETAINNRLCFWFCSGQWRLHHTRIIILETFEWLLRIHCSRRETKRGIQVHSTALGGIFVESLYPQKNSGRANQWVRMKKKTSAFFGICRKGYELSIHRFGVIGKTYRLRTTRVSWTLTTGAKLKTAITHEHNRTATRSIIIVVVIMSYCCCWWSILRLQKFHGSLDSHQRVGFCFSVRQSVWSRANAAD